MEKIEIKMRNTTIPVVYIEASKLLLTDEFMQYVPKTQAQQNLKDRLKMIIPEGLKDFYKPIYDPSFNRFDEITYVEGKTPAIGKTYSWWEQTAKQLLPEWGSRLGTTEDYIAFLGVLIKTFYGNPDILFNPWEAFCDDSTASGHYWNSQDSKEDFEKTGSRMFLGFYDFANTFKILKSKDGNPGYSIASGSFVNEGNEYPIAHISHRVRNNTLSKGVGWIVFDGRK